METERCFMVLRKGKGKIKMAAKARDRISDKSLSWEGEMDGRDGKGRWGGSGVGGLGK